MSLNQKLQSLRITPPSATLAQQISEKAKTTPQKNHKSYWLGRTLAAGLLLAVVSFGFFNTNTAVTVEDDYAALYTMPSETALDDALWQTSILSL